MKKLSLVLVLALLMSAVSFVPAFAEEAAYEQTLFGQSKPIEIDTWVETDPTAFATYEQYAASAESLKTAITLRAESVLGQISGEIPSTKEGQAAEPEKLLDTSGADLSGLTSGYGMGVTDNGMPRMPWGK